MYVGMQLFIIVVRTYQETHPLKFYSTVLSTIGMKVYGRPLGLLIFHTRDFRPVEQLLPTPP